MRSRWSVVFLNLIDKLLAAVLRFPWTVFCLFLSTGLACYLISYRGAPPLTVQKLVYVLLLGAFIGVAAQFATERFPGLGRWRWAMYALAVCLSGAYYLVIAPAPTIDYAVTARTAVAAFSMFCAFLWLPSAAGEFDFNQVALVHFKSAFTAILYAQVLTLGLMSIIATVDILLVKVNGDYYGYMLALVWIFFAPTYYLSLLPRFNYPAAADRVAAPEAVYAVPRFLDVLISYIAIPLVIAYTVVLLAYFAKIGLTRSWPSGQLGPMILAYSGAGLVIYVLASSAYNRVAVFYQRAFPKVLIPVVIMQLVSVYIRLQAYGITESRYYLVLFGLFSFVIGLVLSVKPVDHNGLIALLAAGFAVISVLPPVDAFTLARNSQTARLEGYLQEAGILVDEVLVPGADADWDVRVEATNILTYLYRRGYTKQIAWLPADFKPSADMEQVLGFGPTYPSSVEKERFFAQLDLDQPLDVAGYQVLLRTDTYHLAGGKSVIHDVMVAEVPYTVVLEPVSAVDVRVSLQDADGNKLVATNLYQFAADLAEQTPAGELDPRELTLDVERDGYKLRIIFESIYLGSLSQPEPKADYHLYVLAAVP
ncbi:MAG: DUF4153 domain-containing protein [Firmicutes bacterium]|nr:DUF4153 domain-containing protein [Bacillota bacterium]